MIAGVILPRRPEQRATHASLVPQVWRGVQPAPELAVRELSRGGIFDERDAIVAHVGAGAALDVLAGTITLVLPIPLSDRGIEHEALCHGKATQQAADATGIASWRVVDDWTSRLDRTIDEADLSSRLLGVGHDMNRSASPHQVGDQLVYLPAHAGQAWTVGEALRTVFALHQVALTLEAVPHSLRNAPLLRNVSLRGTLRQAVREIVESYPLRFALDRRWVAGNVVAGAVRCLPAADGCVVPLTWPDEQHRGGDVLSTRAKQRVALRGRHVVAVAPPREVEATILLAPMWDASLAGEDAENYSRTASADFPRYRNVYRLWATNFDGRYVEAGDPRGKAEVDLAALFGEVDVNTSGVRLTSCLTLDDNGQPREPVVQYSVDLGLSWSTYPGRVISQLSAGAIYLDDDELASEYRTAALADAVLLRATVTLVHPQAWTTKRWWGDTLRARAESREKRADSFLWREVSPASIHADAVQAGELASHAADDRTALERWLVDRAASSTDGHSWQVELADAWPLLKPGDQLLNAGGPGRRLDGLAQSVHRAGAVVASIRCVWPDGLRTGTVAPRTVVLCGL